MIISMNPKLWWLNGMMQDIEIIMVCVNYQIFSLQLAVLMNFKK